MSEFNDIIRRAHYNENFTSLEDFIEENPGIINKPVPDGSINPKTPLFLSAFNYLDNHLTRFFLIKGARALYTNSSEPLLIQAIESNIDPRLSSTMIKLIELILANLPKEELQQRSSRGTTPYMSAIIGRLPDRIIEAIRVATDANPANKNIYGRSANYYIGLRERQPKKPTGMPGGARRKSRHNRRNKKRSMKKRR